MALPYPTKVVLPFDIATAQDMNERHANDVALAAGSGLDDGAVTAGKIDFSTFITSSVFAVGSDILIQTGWGYIIGDGASTRNGSVTFPVAYSGTPWLSSTILGYKSGSNPASIDDLNPNVGAFITGVPRTDGSGAEMTLVSRDASVNLASGTRYAYSWIAIGKRA